MVKEGKAFFLEKRSKKLLLLIDAFRSKYNSKFAKVFCFFFAKKKTLLPFFLSLGFQDAI